jgi:hypothetical protein
MSTYHWIETAPVNQYGTIDAQCRSKVSYRSRKQARRVAKKQSALFACQLRAYRCLICGEFHLSRTQSPKHEEEPRLPARPFEGTER